MPSDAPLAAMCNVLHEPTITAIATAPGMGGIGIVRMSGPDAPVILQNIFRPDRASFPLASHRLTHGWIVDPEGEKILDEALAVHMRPPRTYTREDVVEIHCHGSFLVLQEILALTIRQGARPAEPGEFTKRAFLNGRIDLTRAEAVIELLSAKTKTSRDMAIAQLEGRLAKQVGAIRDTMADLLAVLEVAIDFPDEELEILQTEELANRIQTTVIPVLDTLIAASDQGRVFREGVYVVILGRPNVGKSSLLNALLREERAIVTAVPGTTRDTIEEYLDINGMPVCIIDTAGIRKTGEAIEEMGIERAQRKMEEADLVLLVLDASTQLTEEDYSIIASTAGKRRIIVANKIDLADNTACKRLASACPNTPLVEVSALAGTGIGELETSIFTTMTKGTELAETTQGLSPNQRHREALERSRASAHTAALGMANGISADLVAVDLQAALEHLSGIVGATTTEDILDRIFSRFCIGK